MISQYKIGIKNIASGLLVLAIICSLLSGCSNGSEYANVKYGDTVDLSNTSFEELDTSNSTFIRGAWYDDENEYMIIRLKDVYYQYCNLPISTWESFEQADSLGEFYNQIIKGVDGPYSCKNITYSLY